jgi:predicted amidohydrolase
VIELHLQWAEPHSTVAWSNVQFESCDPPAPRRVRLATAHYRPHGKSPEQNRTEFVRFIEEAAQQKVDLLVLPETLTYYGTGRSYADCAELIPGPSTEFFGDLARKHNMYLVVGLLERDKHLVYNVAVLIGPDGDCVGKYRKVCLPRTEVEGGICAGDDFPVFETRFGRVGMMVCYDGFFPEPARELTENGAEVIAFPVWGCNPLLAAARACENQVYVVSSTYTDVSQNWMVSAVFGHQGEMLAQATDWGSISVAEVDLSRPTIWAGLGDFGAEVHRHRPPSAAERAEATRH